MPNEDPRNQSLDAFGAKLHAIHIRLQELHAELRRLHKRADARGDTLEKAERIREQIVAQEQELARLEKPLLEQNITAFAQNQKLTEILQEVKKEIVELREIVEKLSAPPNSYGIFSLLNEDGTAVIYAAGRKLKVNLHPSLDGRSLRRGQELILNEAFNVVEALGFDGQGEVVTMKSRLNDGRVQIEVRQDEERVVEIADSLKDVVLKEGDHLLFDARSGLVLEKLPKSDTEDLLLEEVPDITYAHIGGLGAQIEEIRDALELPYLYAEHFKEHKLAPPKGVLLYGPPGCGKTLIAKAVANSLAEQIAAKTGQSVRGYFINIKGPELLTKWVGETERKIRDIFTRAREKAGDGSPVVIFFDEMDSLFRTRGSGISSDVESTIVPQFLAEIDGVEGLKNVIVIGASNRQDLIDPAVLRPGRFDVKIKIDRPDFRGIQEILKIYCVPELPFCLVGSDYVNPKFYDTEGNYIPADRNGHPRKFYDCDPTNDARNDVDLKIMKFPIRRDTNGTPLLEDMAKYFIQRTAIEIWGLTPDSKKWSRFVELTYADGKQETMHFRHFMSGAIIESIMTRAKKSAVKRLIAGGKKGLTFSDFRDATIKEYQENEDLPNTTNPQEWASVIGKQKGRIVNVRILPREGEDKKVETVSVGHYL